MEIELREIRKSFGETPVLGGISLKILPGEMFFLLGASGCGKTTLLRMLAGFLEPDSGEILCDGRCMGGVPPENRGMPMVFQNYALWPHLTVFENVAYGVRLQKLTETTIRERVTGALEAVRMKPFAERSPGLLSGGQQQRVAMARALAVSPRAMLFDEPLSNLDAKLRVEMRTELLEIHRRSPFTAVYVTHDQEEAMTMATRIAVMDRGVLQQVGAPEEVYTRPANHFVAGFMGSLNRLEARLLEIAAGGGKVEAGGHVFDVDWLPGEVRAGQGGVAVFRPSSVRILEDEAHAGAGSVTIRAEVIQCQYAGASQRLDLMGPGVGIFQALEASPPRMRRVGEKVMVAVERRDWMFFSGEKL